MNNFDNGKYILYSFCIIAVWTALVFFLAYPDKQGLGAFFSVTIYYIFTLFAALGAGTILLSLRLLRLLKNKAFNFLYAFAGVLNVTLGIINLISTAFNDTPELYFLRLFLASFILGLIIIFDMFFIKPRLSQA